MIRATFGKSDKERALVLTVKGHAGYADKGKDVVCAAASILALTAAQDAEDAYGAGKLTGKPLIKLRDGSTRIVLQCRDDDAYAELLHTFFIIQKGFLCLERAAPASVKTAAFGKKRNIADTTV